MKPNRGLKIFAWYSIGMAVVHFIGETYYHFKFGQSIPGLALDYIAVSLLLLGAWLALARGWGAGVLCGAWGVEFCLTYRALLWRMEQVWDGSAAELTRNTAYVLSPLLALSTVSLVIAILLCRPGKRE
jgi:hypothetical protein